MRPLGRSYPPPTPAPLHITFHVPHSTFHAKARCMLATHQANKQQLLNYLNVTRQAVLDTLTGLSEAQLATPLDAGGRTVRDLLAHLLVWDWAKLDLLQKRGQPNPPVIVAMMRDEDKVNAQAAARWQDHTLAELLTELQRT